MLATKFYKLKFCFRYYFSSLCLLLLSAAVPADGVNVGKNSAFNHLVPASVIETRAQAEYAQLIQKAAALNQLVGANSPEFQRLQNIAKRLIPFAQRFHPMANKWKWQVNLINSKQINAFCMPGGKIVFYTAIINNLSLSDDEIAMIMGHEMAHALREHARERMAKGLVTQLGVGILGSVIGNGQYNELFRAGGSLLNLQFSRGDESEADLVGLELAARAGYNPRAGISLWEKMSKIDKSIPLPWLSTHPSGKSRIAEISKVLPQVMPLYQQALAMQKR